MERCDCCCCSGLCGYNYQYPYPHQYQYEYNNQYPYTYYHQYQPQQHPLLHHDPFEHDNNNALQVSQQSMMAQVTQSIPATPSGKSIHQDQVNKSVHVTPSNISVQHTSDVSVTKSELPVVKQIDDTSESEESHDVPSTQVARSGNDDKCLKCRFMLEYMSSFPDMAKKYADWRNHPFWNCHITERRSFCFKCCIASFAINPDGKVPICNDNTRYDVFGHSTANCTNFPNNLCKICISLVIKAIDNDEPFTVPMDFTHETKNHFPKKATTIVLKKHEDKYCSRCNYRNVLTGRNVNKCNTHNDDECGFYEFFCHSCAIKQLNLLGRGKNAEARRYNPYSHNKSDCGFYAKKPCCDICFRKLYQTPSADLDMHSHDTDGHKEYMECKKKSSGRVHRTEHVKETSGFVIMTKK